MIVWNHKVLEINHFQSGYTINWFMKLFINNTTSVQFETG